MKNFEDIFFLCFCLFLLFCCGYLIFLNRKQKAVIRQLQMENKKLLKQQSIMEVKDDSVPLSRLSHELKKEKSEKKVNRDSIKHSISKLEYVSSVPKDIQEKRELKNEHRQNASREEVFKKGIYQKNVLQGQNRITSPVSISNQEAFDIEQLNFDLNEFIKKSEKVVPKIESSSKRDYLKQISQEMRNEMQPQTIELTDYEREQEENAIISYQELLSLKDQIAMVDDEEENVDFVEAFKNQIKS